eukprot:GHVS01085675.1.p1 GENE.GHVS01085675.1~~GHVS01085675.1.p1  ORF type:complete len:328 (-),score=48.00 GHVS01085675.1:860-1843(-)
MHHRGIVSVLWAAVLVCHYSVGGLENEFVEARFNEGIAGFQPLPLMASSSVSSGTVGKGTGCKWSGRSPSLLAFIRGLSVAAPWTSPIELRSSAFGRRADRGGVVGANVGGKAAWREDGRGSRSAIHSFSGQSLHAVDRVVGPGFTVDDKGTVTATGGLEGGIRRAGGPVHEATMNSLEVDPYYDILNNIPMNTIKHKNPLLAHIKRVEPLVTSEGGRTAICHVELDLEGKMRYWEGQSIGVVPPGTNPKTGKPNSVRLYSIASTRYGDDGDGRTVSLVCVRRAVYVDPLTGKEDEEKGGLCSNLLCSSAPGTPLNVVGPSGKVQAA